MRKGSRTHSLPEQAEGDVAAVTSVVVPQPHSMHPSGTGTLMIWTAVMLLLHGTRQAPVVGHGESTPASGLSFWMALRDTPIVAAMAAMLEPSGTSTKQVPPTLYVPRAQAEHFAGAEAFPETALAAYPGAHAVCEREEGGCLWTRGEGVCTTKGMFELCEAHYACLGLMF